VTPHDLTAHQEAAARWSCMVANCRVVGRQNCYGIRPDQFLFSPLFGPLKGSTLACDVDKVSPVTLTHRILLAEKEHAA
jgi:hypothetical protein